MSSSLSAIIVTNKFSGLLGGDEGGGELAIAMTKVNHEAEGTLGVAGWSSLSIFSSRLLLSYT